jgi:hypothetical protein
MFVPVDARYSRGWPSRVASSSYRPIRWGVRSGIGDVQAQQIGTAAASAAAATGSLLTLFAGPGLALAGPVGAIAAGLTQVAFLIAGAFRGCGQTCVQATAISDKVEAYLKQNLSTYLSAPVHYQTLQAAALQNVDNAMASMRAACGDPSLGAAGQRCISERLVRGAPAPWCPKPGGVGCDWLVLYRDPIALDPAVVPDPSSASGILAAVAPSGQVAGVPLADLMLPAGLILAGLLL